jgi:hypothetical protein
VNEGTPQTSQQVRAYNNRLRRREKLQVEKRGWTLDVLQFLAGFWLFLRHFAHPQAAFVVTLKL